MPLLLMRSNEEDQKAAVAVDELIAAIGTVHYSSTYALETARTAYKSLTDAQKEMVLNLPILTDAEEVYKSFFAAGVPSSSAVNDPFAISITTPGSVKDVLVYNEYGLKIGRKAVSAVANSDSTITWTVTVQIGTIGDQRQLTLVPKYADQTSPDCDISATVDITPNCPTLLSFDIVSESAAKNQSIA